MKSRGQITTKYAKLYVAASKKVKGQILDAVVEVSRWSRDNARRRLVPRQQTGSRPGPPGSGAGA